MEIRNEIRFIIIEIRSLNIQRRMAECNAATHILFEDMLESLRRNLRSKLKYRATLLNNC